MSATMMKQGTFTTVTASAAKGDEAEMVVSTVDVDREGDRLFPEGADLAGYLSNPVVLFGHDARSLPVGTATAVTVVEGRGLRARWKWLAGDEFADRVKNAWDQGVLRAASVGFIPRTWKPNDDGGVDVLAWELLEISLVGIPANPAAVRTLKALGLLGGEASAERIAERIAAAFEKALAQMRLNAMIDAAFKRALAKGRE